MTFNCFAAVSGITFIEKAENPSNAPQLDQMGYKAFKKFEMN